MAKLLSSYYKKESQSPKFSGTMFWFIELAFTVVLLILFIIDYKIITKIELFINLTAPTHPLIIKMKSFKTAIILLLCLQIAHSLSVTYQAINSSCVNASYLITKTPPYKLGIPPFSSISIEVDLRHISSIKDLQNVILTLYIYNSDTSSSYNQTLNISKGVNTFRLYATSNIQLSANFNITDENLQYSMAKSLLIGLSMSVLFTPAMPLDQQQASFLFVIAKSNVVSLPYNSVPTTQHNNFTGYLLSSIPDPNNMKSRLSSTQNYNNYWNGNEQIATPYLPYFSNCQNNGDYLYFSQMIHNTSQCLLYGYNSTPINQFKFGSYALSDNCIIHRSCIYDEIPGGNNGQVFFNTLDSSSKNLFYITAQQYSDLYSPIPQKSYEDSDLVKCQLKSAGDNTTSQYPKKIAINVGYYQQTPSKRQIMTCDVQYSLYSQSSAKFTYQLQMNFYPLSHTNILLKFGFGWYIYAIVFVMIGLISNLQFFVFFIYHCLTSVKKKITFRIMSCVRMIKQIFKGVFPAVCIILFLIFIVQIIMNGTFFGYPLSTSFNSVWDNLVINNIGNLASNNLVKIRSARFGVSYIIVSIYLAYQVSEHLLVKQKSNIETDQYEILGRKFKPFVWKKAKIIFGSLVIVIGSSGFIYFTYSNLFNTYIWFFIASMQIGQMVLQQIFNSIFGDVLPCLHMKVSIGVLAYLATMGAIDLYYFILGYLVDVAISTIEIAYLTQIQQKITKFVEQKNEEMHKFYLALLNDEQDEIEKESAVDNALFNSNQYIILDTILNQVQLLQEDTIQQYNEIDVNSYSPTAKQTQLKQQFILMMSQKNKEDFQSKKKMYQSLNKNGLNQKGEKIEKQNKKLQLLIDVTASVVQYMAQPIVVLILWITFNSSTILSNFNITFQTCNLYFLSSIILALFYQINIIIIINVLQVYFNFDYKKLIEKCILRFQKKTTFWIMDDACEQRELEQIEAPLRSSYKYSLSAQMYFIVALFTFSMYMFIVGFITIISSANNFFQDPFMPLIVIFWLLMLSFLQWSLNRLVYFFDIWGCKRNSENKQRTVQKIEEQIQLDQQTQNILVNESIPNTFTYKNIETESKQKNGQKKNEWKVLQSKLKTICKNLKENQFQKEDFKLEYAIKNKDFIRENIDQILPLIESFPENDSQWLGKSSSSNKHTVKKQAKNVDPIISEFIGNWLKRVETSKLRRKENGIQRERKLKKCTFCFKTWAIYYGYQAGTCLQCSKILFENGRKIKEN